MAPNGKEGNSSTFTRCHLKNKGKEPLSGWQENSSDHLGLPFVASVFSPVLPGYKRQVQTPQGPDSTLRSSPSPLLSQVVLCLSDCTLDVLPLLLRAENSCPPCKAQPRVAPPRGWLSLAQAPVVWSLMSARRPRSLGQNLWLRRC